MSQKYFSLVVQKIVPLTSFQGHLQGYFYFNISAFLQESLVVSILSFFFLSVYDLMDKFVPNPNDQCLSPAGLFTLRRSSSIRDPRRFHDSRFPRNRHSMPLWIFLAIFPVKRYTIDFSACLDTNEERISVGSFYKTFQTRRSLGF